MWNEVWIDDHWIPIDGTLGQHGTGAAHIKVTTSDLAGATPYTALLPVLGCGAEVADARPEAAPDARALPNVRPGPEFFRGVFPVSVDYA